MRLRLESRGNIRTCQHDHLWQDGSKSDRFDDKRSPTGRAHQSTPDSLIRFWQEKTVRRGTRKIRSCEGLPNLMQIVDSSSDRYGNPATGDSSRNPCHILSRLNFLRGYNISLKTISSLVIDHHRSLDRIIIGQSQIKCNAGMRVLSALR